MQRTSSQRNQRGAGKHSAAVFQLLLWKPTACKRRAGRSGCAVAEHGIASRWLLISSTCRFGSSTPSCARIGGGAAAIRPGVASMAGAGPQERRQRRCRDGRHQYQSVIIGPSSCNHFFADFSGTRGDARIQPDRSSHLFREPIALSIEQRVVFEGAAFFFTA